MHPMQRIRILVLVSGAPGTAAALLLVWLHPFHPLTKLTLTLVLLALWGGGTLALLGRIGFSLRTIANLIAALNEGDFSIRAHAGGSDPLAEVAKEVNLLAANLRDQRLQASEATALMKKVMEQIDASVFAFDALDRLKLVNRAGEKLLRQPAVRLVGRSAEEAGLSGCLAGEAMRTFEGAFPGASGRWEMRRSTFREGGEPHQLLVLSNLSEALREEERTAWRRLIRVLGHEVNNSLAPIRSIADSLQRGLDGSSGDPNWREDATEGLAVIGSRAEALSRFMEGYARLARLPKPVLAPVEVGALVERAAALERRLHATVVAGDHRSIRADAGQVEQVLINLLRNAVDAALETHGTVRIGWEHSEIAVEIWVEDEGPGLAGTDNLFVPFFTTKPGGTGIGLALSRQIAEAHGGALTLANRREGPGCIARLLLPA